MKNYQRLPDSELILCSFLNNTPPMTRPEIEKVINMKKKACINNNFVIADQIENKISWK